MERSLRAARVATYVYFVLYGTLLGTWVVHIPAIEERVGISHAALGGLLVVLGLGAFAGMQVAGPLTDRLGTRVVVPAGGVLCGTTLFLPGLAHDPWTLAAALLVFGLCNGCLDVSMNAHAVHVEKAYGRPVMSGFHATFSVGGVLAALAGAGTAGAGLNPAAAMAVMGVLGVAVALAAARALLPAAPDPEARASTPENGTSPAAEGGDTRGRVRLLAVLALMVMLCEGAANDWSALHLKDVMGASPGTAAFAYGTFAAAMTVGRLLADPFAARFGSPAILRNGAAMAAVGITLVVLGPGMWAVFTGWALFGLGLSGCVPQLFSAAGHADPAAAGANVSRVAGLGYVGMLAGPAVIGWLTHLVALDHAFVLLILLCVTTAVGARVLRTGPGLIRQAETETADHPRGPETVADHPRPAETTAARTRRCEMAAGHH
ncbi:MFS transporter [Streptomyces caniscabiei]|uniref:MFS transporter n=1 Tax=Streptomyces caniscabiei TaxID=2746961 RepID=UPI0029A02BEE|nr:MFS transporter [Streptomyces caniscabiei]MDX2602359.1 MFS transporter [Streptomyces caniscabiei]MDX2734215.1 MFS transporter [Streptomyces caniscabiei]MDX2779745.1 MFS transporter [Streptomyces caniscabiei]